ncbi:unnamed protein product [Leuciscus chuanchicus]
MIQNAAARLVFNEPKRAHVTPLFISLHWLPLAARIKFKALTLAYRTITGSAPSYFHSLLRVYIPTRHLRSNQLVQTQTDVHQMIQDRMKKIQEIKHSVEMRKRNTEESVKIFTDLIRSIRRCQSKQLKMMEEQQKAAEKQAEDLIKELHQEINELKRRNTELEQLSHTDDHLHLIQYAK